jgi:hypothetical protein
MAQPVIVDLRNIYRPGDMAKHGFTCERVVRPYLTDKTLFPCNENSKAGENFYLYHCPLRSAESNALLELSFSQSLYPKVVKFLAGSKLPRQPARPFAAASPGLRRGIRIPILRKDLRIRAALVHQLATSGSKPLETLVKPDFFGLHFAT